jgi:hypothetical protein
MPYTKYDYEKAIEFALNYPPEIGPYYYNIDKDLYIMQGLDGGWYNIKLQGSFVRSCLKWKGIKKWERIS